MPVNKILIADIDYISSGVGAQGLSRLSGRTILITGCYGFLGFSFLHYFLSQAEALGIKKVIGLDNSIVGTPEWVEDLSLKYRTRFQAHHFDIANDNLADIPGAASADYVLHMASIASPVFYRQFPLETIDANVWGLRKILDFYCDKPVRGILFFSSSEIYGDPPAQALPTSESYRGNVSPTGPRACYDESKRFCETLCEAFVKKYRLPVTIVRPFNNYGPGMKSNDQRAPADFAQAVVENRDIVLFSDGTPSRTFCYVADAITGFIKALVYGEFDTFNIGMDHPEISVLELAKLFAACGQELFGYQGQVKYQTSTDQDYLIHNPNRRCPDLKKAKDILGYHPQITVREGVLRYLRYLSESKAVE